MSSSLSEGVVQLTRPHTGPGIKVHYERNGGFLRLECVDCKSFNSVHGNPAEIVDRSAQTGTERIEIRITIGQHDFGIWISIDGQGNQRTLLSNIWVDAGHEVWISTSHVNAHAVFGVLTRAPLS